MHFQIVCLHFALHENPICRPSTAHHLNAINNWVEQLKYIDKKLY